jgi:hypothetical protein
MLLSPAQREAFQRDGFLHVGGFLPPEKTAELRRTCMDHFAKGHGVSKNGGKIETDILRRFPEVAWLLTWPPALELARQLVGGGAVMHPHETAVHLGPVNRGWHKDSRDYAREDASGTDWQDDYRVIHFAYYLQDHKHRSGALAIKRGSHRAKNLSDGVVVPMRNDPGDLVVFDLRATHTGNTLTPRRSFAWLPPSLVYPPLGPAPRNPLLRPLRTTRAVLQRLPWVYERPHADRLALFLVYGADDQHTRNFFEFLKGRPDYPHLAAYDGPLRVYDPPG